MHSTLNLTREDFVLLFEHDLQMLHQYLNYSENYGDSLGSEHNRTISWILMGRIESHFSTVLQNVYDFCIEEKTAYSISVNDLHNRILHVNALFSELEKE